MSFAFEKNQSVTDFARTTRYRVVRRHRDGTVTVQAFFPLNPNGTDRGGFLGFKYREPAALYRAFEVRANG